MEASVATPASPSFLEHFAVLRDPWQRWKILYPLREVLLVVLCGTIAGAEDFVKSAVGACSTWTSSAASCRSPTAFPATTR